MFLLEASTTANFFTFFLDSDTKSSFVNLINDVSSTEMTSTTPNNFSVIISNVHVNSSIEIPPNVLMNNSTSVDVQPSSFLARDSLYSKTSALVKCIVLFITVTTGWFGNTMTLIALKRHVSSMRKPTAAFIASLSVCTMICGLSAFIQAYWSLRLYYYETPACSVRLDLLMSIPFQQLGPVLVYFQILLLSIDRYIAIVHPFHYENWLTERHIKLMIFASVVCTFCYIPAYVFNGSSSCSVAYTDTQMSIALISDYIVVTIVIFYTYSRIMFVAFQQRKRISSEIVNNTKLAIVSTITTSLSNGNDIKPIIKKENQVPTKKQEFKAAKTVAIIVGFYFLCWTPIVLIRAVKILTKVNLSVVILYMNDVGIIFCQINICLTWLIFGITDKNMKVAFLKILHIKV
ncbi:hypothetical protein HELRODRAFT_167918 [Helobdella robusta]|uniref:G-protein coupled receptors family 1 profile domain-containing protein n=1 Tax=Helobdella robusta TaxID=6412 RepID=T1EZY6_HELRO|nr:hypothetical protein HELRODRAFT_167918 [Helobdella robusta]ESO10071.1 hypothetical protein HELRODRAFT_167918 [Helobdella robusta]